MKRSLAIASVICVALCCSNPSSGQDKSADKSPWEAVPIIPHKGEEKFRKIAFVTRDLGYIAGTKAVYKTEDAGKNLEARFRSGVPQFGIHQFPALQGCQERLLGHRQQGVLHRRRRRFLAPIDADVPTLDLAVGPNGWLMAVGERHTAPVVMQQRGPKAKWETVNLGKAISFLEQYWVHYVAITGPDTAFVELHAGFYPSHILRTTDGGKTWKEVFTKNVKLTGMQFIDEKHGWITGRGSLWMTEDGGDTWKAQVNPEDSELQFLKFGPSGSTFGVAPVSRCPRAGVHHDRQKMALGATGSENGQLPGCFSRR